MRNEYVRGIVAYEPGSGFVFPEGEVPETMPSAAGPLAAEAVPLEDVVGKRKLVPIDHAWVRTARDIGVCLGDQ